MSYFYGYTPSVDDAKQLLNQFEDMQPHMSSSGILHGGSGGTFGEENKNIYSALGYKNSDEFMQDMYKYVTGQKNYEWNKEFLTEQQKFASNENALTRAFNAEEAEKARLFNADEAEKARQFNKAEAELNRAFQENLSNTAYQRAFADMKEAGLNPYLAYAQGGAPISSGSAATSQGASGPSASASAIGAGGASTGAGSGQMLQALTTLLSGLGQTAVGLAGVFSKTKAIKKI